MKILMATAAAALLALGSAASAASLTVTTSEKCTFNIVMRPDLAPNHVARITALAKKGFYNGQVFHRVISGFMAQTGDPTGSGMGGSEEPDLKAEFSKEHFGRGVVGMARSSNPDSANSQFFIMFADNSSLDNQYTVWGSVDAKGMECVDRVAKGEPPQKPSVMEKVTVGK